MNKFILDFETQEIEKKMCVWAFATCHIETESITIGKDIDDFMSKIEKMNNPIFYCHNLKFDGSYIIDWLFKNGFRYIRFAKEKTDRTFTTLINNENQIFSIFVYFKVGNKTVRKATFYDSYKIIPLSVEEISQAFGIKEKKLKIDYKQKRSLDHKLTIQEIDYIKNDVLIVAKALKYFFNSGLKKITLGSNALDDFKSTLKFNRFIKYFPYIKKECDEDMRKAYSGGYLYINEKIKNQIIKNTIVLDVNSLYPNQLLNKFLPVQDGIFFEGKYQYDRKYPLYIQSFTCSFKLKEGKLPTVKLNSKEYMWAYSPGEYVIDSHSEIINLIMTNVDLEIFFDHYDVFDLKFKNGWKFRGAKGLFSPYINKWNNIKEEASKKENLPLKMIAKYMLNYLYGKFSTRLDNTIKEPYFDEETRTVKFKKSSGIEKNGVYLPISLFVSAYGRKQLINQAQKIKDFSLQKYGKDMYLYSDTDSIHTNLPIEDIKKLFKIDSSKIGAWKIEGEFEESKYVKLKTYCHKKNNTFEITCSGLPKNLLYYKKLKNGHTIINKVFIKKEMRKEKGRSALFKKNNLIYKVKEIVENGKEEIVEHIFSFDQFKNGFTTFGKLKMEQGIGGMKLVEKSFTITDKNIVEMLKKK